MKRTLIIVFLSVLSMSVIADAKTKAKKAKKPKPPCAENLDACPDKGCGTDFDPNLNLRKNIQSDDQEPTMRNLAWMKKLKNPVDFKKGDAREKLTALGEGQRITVVAFALVATFRCRNSKLSVGNQGCVGSD